MRAVLLVVMAAGCGRFGFEDVASDASPTTAVEDAETLGTTDGPILPSTWQLAPVQPPTTENLWALQVSSANDMWVAGTNGYIAHWNGSTWTPSTSPETGTLYIAWAPSPTDIWISGQLCKIVRYQGASWTSVANPCTGNKPLNSIEGTSTSNVWVVGEQGNILEYNGSTWTNHSQSNLSYWDVLVNAANDVLISGTQGTILHWNGSTMTNETSAATGTLASFAKVGTEYWLVGADGTILHKAGGTTWTTQPSPVTSGTLYDIYAATATDIWAVGTGGVIIHNDGTAWSLVQSPTTVTLRNIKPIPGGGIVASGDLGVVLTHP